MEISYPPPLSPTLIKNVNIYLIMDNTPAMIRFIIECIFQYIAKLKAHNSGLYCLEHSILKCHCQIGANYPIVGASQQAHYDAVSSEQDCQNQGGDAHLHLATV